MSFMKWTIVVILLVVIIERSKFVSKSNKLIFRELFKQEL